MAGRLGRGWIPRDLKHARKLRGLRLGKVRLEEVQALAEISGSMEQATVPCRNGGMLLSIANRYH